MSFHGGLLGVDRRHPGLRAAQRRRSPFMLSDLVAIVAPIGLFFGRLANFINGELWGRVTDVPWAMIFPRGGPLPRHPSQLYQAFFEGVLLSRSCSCRVAPHRRPAPARPADRRVLRRLRRGPHRRRIVPRARCLPRLSSLGTTGSPWACCCRCRCWPFGGWLIVRAYRSAARRARDDRAVTTELGRLIARRIALTGPISVADFMAEALGHPRLGYYRRALPLGAAGDFTTAPEISQMFGELLGAWLAERWLAMGRPRPVRLVELGPGRGTLMADALRATRGVAGLPRRARPPSRRDQRAAARRAADARSATFTPTWHERFERRAGRPDAAGRQRILRRPAGAPVREDRARLGRAHGRAGTPTARRLRFALAPGRHAVRLACCPTPPTARRRRSAKPAAPLAAAIGARVRARRRLGADRRLRLRRSGHGASLQAVRGHRGADVLDRPGETDLSAHVDFAALAAAPPARATFGPVGQGDFLRRLGIAAACGNLEGARGDGAAPRHRRGIGALDRARPNGHLVPRPGRGRRQKRRAGRVFGRVMITT